MGEILTKAELASLERIGDEWAEGDDVPTDDGIDVRWLRRTVIRLAARLALAEKVIEASEKFKFSFDEWGLCVWHPDSNGNDCGDVALDEALAAYRKEHPSG